MKLNGREEGIQALREPIYSWWAVHDTYNSYIKRRGQLVNITKELRTYKSDWLSEFRIIAQGYDRLIEYRVVTGVDKDGKEYETRWYGEWLETKRGDEYVYDPAFLDTAKWIEVPTVNLYI